MPFCAKCGASVEPNVQFCPSCGSPIGVSSTATSPPTTGPPAMGPSYSGSVTAYTSADTVALGKIKTFSLLGIIGILLGVIIPLATGFGFASLMGGSVTGAAIGIGSAVIAGVAISIIGFIIGLVSIFYIRSAFKELTPVSQQFSLPSKMVLALFVGLALFVIAFLVFFGGMLAAASSGSGSGALGILLGSLALFGLGGILALIGVIGIIIGLWRSGERYQEGLLKIGGILFIIPYADIVAPFLVYFGASSALNKVRSTVH